MASSSAEKAGKPLTDLPVTREHIPKGITLHAGGSSTEVHFGYDVLHAGPVEAVSSPGDDNA